jgi:hypothetical protein
MNAETFGQSVVVPALDGYADDERVFAMVVRKRVTSGPTVSGRTPDAQLTRSVFTLAGVLLSRGNTTR